MSDAEFRAIFARFDPSAEPRPESVERLLAEIDLIIGAPGAAPGQPDGGTNATTGPDASRAQRAYLVEEKDHRPLAFARARARSRHVIGVLVAVAAVIVATVAVAVTRPSTYHKPKPAAPTPSPTTVPQPRPVVPPTSPTTVAQPQLYWLDAAGIGRANVDGTGITRQLVPHVGAAICGGTVAADRNYVYWTVPRAGGGVARARRDGTGVDQSFITVTSSYVPQCVAVGGAHVYWTSAVLGPDGHPGPEFTIGRANLDGTGVQESLISGITPQCLAVDGAHIYWGGGGGAIGRANLDGTGVDTAFVSAARGCGLVVDGAHIYWAGGGGIARANLDGTGVNESFIPTPVPGSGVLPCAHDSTYLYWNTGLGRLGGPLTPSGSIGRARLDGTGVQDDFITGLESPSGCAIGP